jgi:hypothetical protein
VPAGKSVSGSPSVTICFGRKGDGAVAGLMVPAALAGALVTVPRSPDVATFIDVNSGKSIAAYNDKFVNPRDFAAGSSTWKQVRAHLKKSLELFGYK